MSADMWIFLGIVLTAAGAGLFTVTQIFLNKWDKNMTDRIKEGRG